MLVSLLCDESYGLQEIIDTLLPLLLLLSIRYQTILDFITKSFSILQSQNTLRKRFNFKGNIIMRSFLGCKMKKKKFVFSVTIIVKSIPSLP